MPKKNKGRVIYSTSLGVEDKQAGVGFRHGPEILQPKPQLQQHTRPKKVGWSLTKNTTSDIDLSRDLFGTQAKFQTAMLPKDVSRDISRDSFGVMHQGDRQTLSQEPSRDIFGTITQTNTTNSSNSSISSLDDLTREQFGIANVAITTHHSDISRNIFGTAKDQFP